MTAHPQAEQRSSRRFQPGFFGRAVRLTVTLAAAVPLLAGLLSAWLAPRYWVADLVTHFTVQVAAWSLLCAGLLALMGARWRALAMLAGIVWLAHPVAAYLRHPFSPDAEGPRSDETAPSSEIVENKTYRFVTYNVLMSNDRYQDIADYLAEHHPDFILFVEVDQTWADEMDFELQSHYKHRFARPRPDQLGLAFYSKYSWSEARSLPDLGFPAIEVKLELPEGPLHVIGHHPMAPTRSAWFHRRNAYYRKLANYIVENPPGAPFILAGDFNTTPWSPVFRNLLRRTGLRDTAKARGIQPTWYAFPSLVAGLPIDHILASNRIRVVERRIGPEIGSDHRPVILDFRIARKPQT